MIKICDGCVNLDKNILHKCRADIESCIDGFKCPDFIGENKCACLICN